MEKQSIRHMVIFNLKYEINTPEAEKFLQDGKTILSSIPVVKNFEVLKQVSSKNDFDYGFSMEFDNRSKYDEYNAHPSHVGFVKQRWESEVTSFMEIDFGALNIGA